MAITFSIISLGLMMILCIVATILLCQFFYGSGKHDERMRVLDALNDLPPDVAGASRLVIVQHIITKMKEEA